MDDRSVEKRSYNMSQIKSKNTKPEELVCKFLFSHGFRYRKNVNKLPGKPDIVLAKYRAVIFVNGCFWHMHGCSRSVVPKSNREYWIPKLEKNVLNDSKNEDLLIEQGWNVIIVWECELEKQVRDDRLKRLIIQLKSNKGIYP
ncbi:MAG: DNA mismatch endonuclease Vsr [Candidatus Delongbacteria bacterium]|nr:DNA mismatch endonuclease Vsr [Candidatus Delongbacteria bacterium]